MITPRIEISIAKIAHNAKKLKDLYASKGVGVFGVTKVICGAPVLVETLVKSGIGILADSRIDNIRRMRDAGIQARFVLLRTPIPSQVEAVVKYVDISFNSELSVIRGLSRFARQYNIIHKIILMVEMGDLREGLMPADLEHTVKAIMELDGIEIVGIGTNLACFGGVQPDEEKMKYLSTLATKVEETFGLTLEFVSGGNSANYNWFMSTKKMGKINNLRLGESIYLGREPLYRKPIPGMFTDAFALVAEVIESKIKPSVVYGMVCQNAFGSMPEFQDRGQIRRVILGIGLQDVLVSGLTPRLDMDILGESSDHIILDAKDVKLEVEHEVEFNLNYGEDVQITVSA